MFNEIQETGKMKRTTRKIYQVEMNADSIQEQDYLFFLGLLYSSTKLDQEMLQCRAELPRKKKSMLLFACIITSNIEIHPENSLYLNIQFWFLLIHYIFSLFLTHIHIYNIHTGCPQKIQSVGIDAILLTLLF